MTPAINPVNRFFVSPDYSVFYRRVKKLAWEDRTTSDYAFVSTINGSLTYHLNASSGKLTSARSLVLAPNCFFGVESDQAEFLVMSFRSSLVVQHSFDSEPHETHARLSALLHDFTTELFSEKPGKEIVMRAMVEQVLVEILRNYAHTERSAELEFSRVGIIDRRIRRSVELMHTQLDQDLPLRDLAAASYLSPFHFARLFKKITGATPHNYLAAIRTNRAQLLLAETDLSITEIGSRVGYLSASHFTKAFRLATGTTPREFRKALITRQDT
jgi:AraC family transcriptional regulator